MASSQYYVRNKESAYFLTMTVVDWVEVSSGLTPSVLYPMKIGIKNKKAEL